MQVSLVFSLFVGATIAKLLIPFAEHHDSLFSYQLSTKNVSSSLVTSGKVIAHKQDNQIKFNFTDCFINSSENLFLQPLIERISETPILYVDENDSFESKNESVTWDIDPLFVMDVFRLSSFPTGYSVDDDLQMLDENGKECGFEIRKVNETETEVKVRFYMSLKDCDNSLFEVDSEVVEAIKDGFVEVFWCFEKLHIDVLTAVEYQIQLLSETNFSISGGSVSFVKFLKNQ